MAGLTQEQFKALKKEYQALRDAGLPRLTTAQFHLAVAEIEETMAGEGSLLERFKKAAQIRRDARPDPLKPKQG